MCYRSGSLCRKTLRKYVGAEQEQDCMMELIEIISGAEWVIVAICAGGLLLGWYLVLSVQPDMRNPERGENDDDQAVEMFVRLITETRQRIVIHDDGNNSPLSVYNNDKVIEAVKGRIRKQRINVHCLFNDNEPLKLLDLARGAEYRGRVHIWYANGDRPDPDIHYKIVDDGKLLHLSNHEHRASERGYALYRVPWWAWGSRRRISRPYREHFEHGLKDAVPAQVA